MKGGFYWLNGETMESAAVAQSDRCGGCHRKGQVNGAQLKEMVQNQLETEVDGISQADSGPSPLTELHSLDPSCGNNHTCQTGQQLHFPWFHN